MPQAPTANMALVKPTENGDTGVWATLLDAMFDLIDQHDHTPGKGVKVPLATGATVTGDVSWSSGGSFFAVTNLRAVDFQPQPSSAMTSYAGALFCNSANNELTWRTTAGALVQVTSGAALNIPGVGGFGGDYITAGALADFTDSTDTYAFRQQVGAAVRQYARVQHADVELFEYKAQPAAGVPTTRVRLKSPAALAASYDITWLPALPASTRMISVDTTGQLTNAEGTRTLSIPCSAMAGSAVPAQTITEQFIKNTAAGSAFAAVAPIGLPVGSRILAVRAYVFDSGVGPTKVQASLISTVASTDVATTVASSAVSAGTATFQTLTIGSLTTTMITGSAYHVKVASTTGTDVCGVILVEVDYDRP